MRKNINIAEGLSKKIKQLCKSKYSSGPKQAFDDIIQLAFNMLSMPQLIGTFPHTRLFIDEALVHQVSRYEKEPESWKLLSSCVGDFLNLIYKSEPFTDVIGTMYDEYLGQVLGQFLTPTDVADTLAALQMVMLEKPTKKIRMGDVCGCGAGSLVLAQLRHMHNKYGTESIRFIEVETVDLDPNMVRLCTVQIVMSALIHRIPLASYASHCANALTHYDQTPSFVWKPNQMFEEFYKEELGAMEQITNKFKEMETAL